MRPAFAVLAAFSLLLAGCAIHPLPRDVTRESTKAIVQKIRCEARQALDNITAELLDTYGDPKTRILAAQVRSNVVEGKDLLEPRYLSDITLDPQGRQLFRTYALSAVTFDFKFTISEQNDNSAKATFVLPNGIDLFTLEAGAGARLDRTTLRTFQITSSFRELHVLDRKGCEEITARSGNLIYPITGKIGLEEVFRTFVEIDSSAGIDSTDTRRFSDTLTFKTTLSAGLDPKMTLGPVIDERFQVTAASATLKSTRTDEHEVTVAIARGDSVVSFSKGRIDAKRKSLAIADELRVENFFDRQRLNDRRLDEILR